MEHQEIIFPDYVKNDLINSEDKNGKFNNLKYKCIHTQETEKYLNEIGIEPKEAHYMLKNDLHFKNRCLCCNKEIPYHNTNHTQTQKFCSQKCNAEYKRQQIKKNKIKKDIICKNSVHKIYKEIIFPDYVKNDLINSEDKNGNFNGMRYIKIHTQETEKYLNEIGLEPYEAYYMLKNDLHFKNKCLWCNKEIPYYINGNQTRAQNFCSKNCRSEYKKQQIKKDKIKKDIIRKNNIHKIYEEIIFPDYVQNDLINSEDKNGKFNGYKYKCIHTKKTEKYLNEIGIEPKEAHYMLKNDLHFKNRCLWCDKEMPYLDICGKRKYYCSLECCNASPEPRLKMTKTHFKKYGVVHSRQRKEVIIKSILSYRKNTNRYFILINKLKNTNIMLQSSEEEFYTKELVKYKCKICQTIFESNLTKISSIICPKCKLEKGYSKEEKEIYNFIISFYRNNIIENDRKILGNKELDIYIPEHKIAIEFNGIYWHSLKYLKNEKYHQEKSLKCMNKQIKLFHINEYYWNHKQNLIKDIIRYKFGIYENVINANECVFQSILKKDREQFLTFMRENTLEQPKLYDRMYGFFNNGELIAVCYVENEILQYHFNYKYKIENGLERCVFLVDLDETYIKINLDYQLDEEILNNKFKFYKLIKPTYNYFRSHCINKISQEEIESNKCDLILEKYDNTKSIEENLVDNKYYKVYNAGYVILKYQPSK